MSTDPLERDSYDSWGRPRNPAGTDNPPCSITSLTTRGFTNQEMMQSFCTVNLNARIYDPTIARFLTADPAADVSYNLQELDHYSYANNGPLSFTDTSGEDPSGEDPIEEVVVTADRIPSVLTFVALVNGPSIPMLSQLSLPSLPSFTDEMQASDDTDNNTNATKAHGKGERSWEGKNPNLDKELRKWRFKGGRWYKEDQHGQLKPRDTDPYGNKGPFDKNGKPINQGGSQPMISHDAAKAGVAATAGAILGIVGAAIWDVLEGAAAAAALVL